SRRYRRGRSAQRRLHRLLHGAASTSNGRRTARHRSHHLRQLQPHSLLRATECGTTSDGFVAPAPVSVRSLCLCGESIVANSPQRHRAFTETQRNSNEHVMFRAIDGARTQQLKVLPNHGGTPSWRKRRLSELKAEELLTAL